MFQMKRDGQTRIVCPSEMDEGGVAEVLPSESLDNRSFREMLGGLADDATALVHQHVDLARAEAEQKMRAVVGALAMWVTAAIATLLALGAFTTAVIFVLARVLPEWAAALIVGGGLIALAAALGLVGKHQLGKAAPLVPEETLETLKEDLAWAKSQLKSARK
jgi:hypothetical protein